MSSEQENSVLAGVAKPTSQLAADINAGFAFFLDCVVNLFVLSGLLIGAFQFPSEVVFGKIIPGSIVGIVVGNGLFIWHAKKVAKETGNAAITSIPLGIDLPTVLGMVFFIVGPVYAVNVGDLGELAAAEKAWHLGVASAFWMAIVKFVFSFFGSRMQKELPQMALIGAMAGISLVWLGAEAIFGIFSLPEVGIISLIIMAFSLISGHKLPFALPGAILAIVAGTVLYYILAFSGFSDAGYILKDAPELRTAFPMLTLIGPMGMFGDVTGYLGIIIPFAILIAASSVNVVAGARIIGDTYDPGKVVRIDSLTTAVSALFGGMVQTTPYFGHTTYKRMGARTGYAIGVSVFVAVGGFLGIIAFASQMTPEAVLKPILVVVACDILRLAFSGGSVAHAPALLFAAVPGILNYAYTKVSDLYGRVGEAVTSLPADWMYNYTLLGAMSRGYILTSLIWGTMIVWIIDRKLIRAACAAFVAAALVEFGIIHSVLPSSGMYTPWNIPDLGGAEILPHRLAIGYLIAGMMLVLFALTKSDAEKAGNT